ncbi:hypothetical protein BU26DRAFT_597405 [Trematosphaeria pertusa]|uniref:Nephrocystin 3-like N-terminal domain-containing protein n=1 Tax=Trematosphaeria pertusa TaxID=390896 RepID=A0A6A6IB63_9PLEO|nr:uncharacterized protein BU26DRAFT_597405 [Trematosphaeria pertusa]KAF2247479.1 hypothetical protein BU26DRAFT_597405 [Trematosphaeria pertusa]
MSASVLLLPEHQVGAEQRSLGAPRAHLPTRGAKRGSHTTCTEAVRDCRSAVIRGSSAIYALREILSDILNGDSLQLTYLLVDALDECASGLSDLLHIITDHNLAWRSRVKWLVTSRNVPDIERFLQPDSLGVKVSLELSASHVSKAVASFVDFKVQRLAAAQSHDAETQAEVQLLLRKKAEGTFLWVSLVCKELESVPLYRTRTVLRELPPGLDPLYDRMIEQILAQNDTQTARFCEDILRSVTLAYRPLRLKEVAATAGLPTNEFNNVQGVTDLLFEDDQRIRSVYFECDDVRIDLGDERILCLSVRNISHGYLGEEPYATRQCLLLYLTGKGESTYFRIGRWDVEIPEPPRPWIVRGVDYSHLQLEKPREFDYSKPSYEGWEMTDVTIL